MNKEMEDSKGNTNIQHELFDVDEKEIKELTIKREEETKRKKELEKKRQRKEMDIKITFEKEQEQKEIQKRNQASYRKIKQYLDWGRFPNNNPMSFCDAAFEKLMDMKDQGNNLSLIFNESSNEISRFKKLKADQKIKFILPLYEEFFGSLEENFEIDTMTMINSQTGEEMDHEWNLDEYERLITETFETFTNYGDVNQLNNSFILKISREYITPGGSSSISLNELEEELLENFKYVFMG